MGVLRFSLLGPFEAFRDDERIPADAFRTRPARCVLKLLLTEHGRPVSFGRIADAFWPDAEPVTARNSVHVAVRTLRRVLEPDLARGADSRFIVTVGETYRFVPNDCVVDVDAFLSHRQAALAAEARGDSRVAIDSYRAALAIYRGEYVAEEADAEWVLASRERLREAYLDAAERLSALLAAAGQATEAVSVIERALHADPLREDLYARLMRIHAGAGRRAHALAAFERCRRVERASLGIEPGADLARLRAEIVAGRSPSAPGTPEGARALSLVTTFVGREHELAALRDAWTRSLGETGRLVFLGGEAGIGKTRLAQHFADRLGREARTLWLTAHELGSDVEYAPLLASLGQWLDGDATTRQVEQLGAHALAIAHLFPRVRAVWPDCPSADALPMPGQLLEAFTAALLARNGTGRALVVLDDAQWADRNTLEWLAYAIRRFPAGTLFVVIARPGEGRAGELDLLRSDARRHDQLLSLEVPPLGETEVERLVDEATVGSTRSKTLARRLHQATRGNALFVVEAVRELPHTSAADETTSVPRNVRDAILARLKRLPKTASAVLGALAVLGTPCDADLLARATGDPTEEVIDALDVLLARQLVRVDDGAQAYAIEHPFVARVVYEAVGPGRREEQRRRAGAAAIRQPETVSA